jgi:hypothetical protein
MVSDRGLPRAMMIPGFSCFRPDVHMMLVDCYSCHLCHCFIQWLRGFSTAAREHYDGGYRPQFIPSTRKNKVKYLHTLNTTLSQVL